jgi:hypothetical protein
MDNELDYPGAPRWRGATCRQCYSTICTAIVRYAVADRRLRLVPHSCGATRTERLELLQHARVAASPIMSTWKRQPSLWDEDRVWHEGASRNEREDDGPSGSLQVRVPLQRAVRSGDSGSSV